RYPPPFNLVERTCVRRSAGWIAAGETVAETLLTRPHYATRPHATIPLGVDRNVFRPNRAAGESVCKRLGWEPGGPPVVGFLALSIPAKGLDLLAAARERLTTPWRALFVGGGPMEEWLRRWAACHAERVRIVTGVSHDDVPPYLNAMDLLAAPSQTTPKW